MGCLGTYLNCYYHFTYLGMPHFLPSRKLAKRFRFSLKNLKRFALSTALSLLEFRSPINAASTHAKNQLGSKIE